MSTIINPDKSVVKKAKKLFKQNGGFCPEMLSQGIKYNCKDCACTEFEISNEMICPLGYYIKNKENM
jgi:hypothetical protein